MGAVWSSLEVNTCIICSCLPIVRKCIARCCPRFLDSSAGTANANSSRASVAVGSDSILRREGNKEQRVCVALEYVNRGCHQMESSCSTPGHWMGTARCQTRQVFQGPQDSSKHLDDIQVAKAFEQDPLEPGGDHGDRSDSESTKRLVRIQF